MNDLTCRAPPGAYPPTRYAWFVVTCLHMVYAVAILDRQILALLVQPIRSTLAISDTQFSLVAGFAFAIFYATFGLLLGKAADHYNRRNMIIGGIVVWTLATAACGLARNFHELFLARIFVGAGEAALTPAAYSLIGDYFPKEHRSRPFSVFTMGVFTGAGAAFVMGSAAIAATSSSTSMALPLVGEVKTWQAIFIMLGLLGLGVALLVTFVKEPQRQEVIRVAGDRSDLMRFLDRKGTVIARIIIALSLSALVYYAVAIWSPAVFMRRFGWSAARIGTALGLIQMIAGTAGILVGGWWVGRSRHASNNMVFTMTRNVLLMMIPFSMCVGLAPSAPLALSGLACLMFATAMVAGQSAVALFHVTPNMFRGRIIAAYILSGTVIGLGMGSTLIAAITDYVFHNDKAVGASFAIVAAGAALFGALCIHSASRSNELNLEWWTNTCSTE
jgi:MFS family permease